MVEPATLTVAKWLFRTIPPPAAERCAQASRDAIDEQVGLIGSPNTDRGRLSHRQ
ncbi:hypothetical protein [Sphingomonas jejuensis]|uniref:hypothetical protein n=1 Tax=Sphingomonas jejuensis TaxID=904715 RepID=UPI001439259B|nr:hypothetical protein [Sphingomonas jejuensis]